MSLVGVGVIVLLMIVSCIYVDPYRNVSFHWCWSTDNFIILRRLGSRFIDDKRLDVLYTITGEKYTLTVRVDPPDLVSKVQVFSGSVEDYRLVDPRAGNPYPDAHLVEERRMGTSGEVEFVLRPGRYFIYPYYNENSLAANKPSLVSFGSLSTDVYLDRNEVIAPKFVVGQ